MRYQTMTISKGNFRQSVGPGEKKPFRNELHRVIAQDNRNRLTKCVEKLLDLAAEVESWAIQMLADRLDGKALARWRRYRLALAHRMSQTS
jgi:hypothetical protein